MKTQTVMYLSILNGWQNMSKKIKSFILPETAALQINDIRDLFKRAEKRKEVQVNRVSQCK